MKQRQREGTEPNKGTVRERKRGESSRLPLSELLTGTLEHRHQSGDTGGEILGMEKTEERIPQRKDALREAKLSVGLQSTQEERERISVLSDIAESRQQRGDKLEWPAN